MTIKQIQIKASLTPKIVKTVIKNLLKALAFLSPKAERGNAYLSDNYADYRAKTKKTPVARVSKVLLSKGFTVDKNNPSPKIQTIFKKVLPSVGLTCRVIFVFEDAVTPTQSTITVTISKEQNKPVANNPDDLITTKQLHTWSDGLPRDTYDQDQVDYIFEKLIHKAKVRPAKKGELSEVVQNGKPVWASTFGSDDQDILVLVDYNGMLFLIDSGESMDGMYLIPLKFKSSQASAVIKKMGSLADKAPNNEDDYYRD